MHLHILGVCGTFMAGIAVLAQELGHTVTGSDRHAYPPMSDLLAAKGIRVDSGYLAEHLTPVPDLVVVGNAMTRGNPAVEFMLDTGIRYASGPQWLAENVLRARWPIVVAGTHGKTTTSAMIAWILEYSGMNPGFLIGGLAENFGLSARLGQGCFVVEGDEYDSAFFDKRSKFVHYLPRTAVLNSLEFDHADIFDDLQAIKRQFHHLIRVIPRNGLIIYPPADRNIADVLAMGQWTPAERFGQGGDWCCTTDRNSGHCRLYHRGDELGALRLPVAGEHNLSNALAAILAARHAGVPVETSLRALAEFKSVKRRLEDVACVNGIRIVDDFAHHPTAVTVTLTTLRAQTKGRLYAVLEPASNTMRLGVHAQQLMKALELADQAFLYRREDLHWDPGSGAPDSVFVHSDLETLLGQLISKTSRGDTIVMMSNAGAAGLRTLLPKRLREQYA